MTAVYDKPQHRSIARLEAMLSQGRRAAPRRVPHAPHACLLPARWSHSLLRDTAGRTRRTRCEPERERRTDFEHHTTDAGLKSSTWVRHDLLQVFELLIDAA